MNKLIKNSDSGNNADILNITCDGQIRNANNRQSVKVRNACSENVRETCDGQSVRAHDACNTKAYGTNNTKACDYCNVAACEFADQQPPAFCPQPNITKEMHDVAMRLYNDPENHAIMESAARVSANTVNSTRVQDTLKFASYMKAHRIGIATCTAMLKETRILSKLLRRAGFEVFAIGCKLESNHPSDLGIGAVSEKSVICNPIMQALMLNEAECDLNIMMGICVGHDALFTKYSNAPTTTLVAKDFSAANNPCAVLYTAKSVYKSKLDATIEEIRERREAHGE